MKKRLLALLVLALVMVLTLASCGDPIGDWLNQFLDTPPVEEEIKEEYVVYFLAGSGTSVPNQTVEEGGLVTKPETPYKEGYLFDNWYKDDAYTEVWDFDSDTVTQNTILYGKWNEHTHSGGTATCTEKAICEVCGHAYGAFLDHVGGTATCTEKAICEVCGTEYGQPLGHDVVIIPGTAPTCTEAGLTDGAYCSRCDAKAEQEVIPALGHTVVVDEAVAPTCTETGLTEGSHCSACDEIFEAQEVVPALGHTWGEWITDTEPTEDAEGTKHRECACGEVETGTIPALSHTHSYTSEVTTAPTCTADGVKTYTCSCGDTYTESVPAIEHDYDVVVTDPTCTEGGYTTYTCAFCDYSYTADETDALGHKDEDGDFKCDNECGKVMEPADGTALTFDQAKALANLFAHNTYTTNKYYVTGIIDEVYNTMYGNINLEGTDFVIYGLYSFDGETRYDAMTYKPVKGDEITVYGVIGKYNTTLQMKNGWLDEVVAHEHSWSEATCKAPATCSICGDTTGELADHVYVGGVCSVCGHEEGVVPNEIIFELGTNGKAEHSDGTDTTEDKTYTETAYGYTLTVTSTAKMYIGARDAKGNSCLKFGTSSKTGNMSFTVPENVTKVIIYVAGYKAATTTNVKVNGTQYTVKTASNNGEYFAIEVDTTTTKTVTFETVTYRAMVNSIVFVLGETEEECTHVDEDHDHLCDECDEVVSECVEGTPVVENNVDPDCVNDGSYDTVVYCTVCGEELSRVTTNVDALGHDYEEVVTAPDCVNGGYTTYTCHCGHSYVDDETDALGHAWGEWIIDTEATEEADGLKHRVCGTCGEVEEVAIPSLQHEHRYDAVVTDPTCTEQGYTTHTCRCEDSYVDSYVDALGHTEGEAVVENEVDPTCTAAGSYDTVVYCSVCEVELSRVTTDVAATGHDHEEVVTAPTCTAAGYTTYTCACGDTYTADEVPALGHKDEDGDFKCDNECGKVMEPADGTTLTFEQAKALANLFAHNTYTTNKYYVTGIITEVYNTQYGNIKLEGTDFVIYGLYSFDGKIRYDAMTYKPVKGDEITVYGVIGKYNTTLQMKNGWLDEVVAHEHEWDKEATCTTSATCEICGATNLAPHTPSENELTCVAPIVCTVCEKVLETVDHVDENENGKCDVCKATLEAATEDQEIVFELGANGKAEHSDGTDTTEDKKYTENVNGYTLTITSTAKMYNGARDAKGNSCLKFGTSSKTGNMSFTVPEDVTKVIIYVSGYKAATTTNVKVNGTQYTVKTASNNGAYTAIEVDTTTTKNVEFVTVTYRAMVNSIVFVVPGTAGVTHEHNEATREENRVEPTCTVAGSYDRVVYCADEDCGEEISRETITLDAHGHDYEEVVTAPDCVNGGYTTYTCHCGHSYVDDETDALGHAWGEWIIDTEATEEADGLKHHVCGTCGEVEEVAIPSLQHEHRYDAVVTAPTCTEQGYTTHTCRCEDSYVDSYVDALGHTEGEAVVENEVDPTCTAAGSYDTVVYCSVCEVELSRVTTDVAATGHDYDEEVTAPTCTAAGYTTYTCACGDTYTADEVPALGHKDEDGDFKCDNECGKVMEPADGTALTFEQAKALANLFAHNTYTTNKYYVTGTITEVYNTQYGNIKLEGTDFVIYGLYSFDGKTRYDAMTYKPVKGDEITVYGVIGKYNTTLQMKNGWLDEVVAHKHEWDKEATCTVSATCEICGATNLAPHTPSENELTCVAPIVCTVCDEVLETTDHVDENENGKCDVCKATLEAATEDQEIVFELGTNGSASHSDGTDTTEDKKYTETVNGYTLTITSTAKMYNGARDAKGNSCLKFGTSSKTGNMSFTVPDDVTKVIIYVSGYKAATTTNVKVNGTQYTVKTASNNGAYTAIEIDTTTNKKVEFVTVTYRAMVNSIVFVVPGTTGVTHEHNEATREENRVEPTCTAAGSYEKVTYCADEDCGEVLERETITLDSVGHADVKPVDHKCDTCGETLSQCADVNPVDHECDVCGLALTRCEDGEIKNHVCEICGDEVSDCADKNKDHNCDVCGAVLSECETDYRTHYCEYCGKKLTVCVDNDKDHECDVCGLAISVCVDNDKDHKCDICDDKMSDCADDDHNHFCDICGIQNSQCMNINPTEDHDCDWCGKENVTECVGGEAKVENKVDPTCTAAGSYDTVVYCTVCGEELDRDTTTVDALGHTADEAVEENRVDSTCTVAGSYDAVVYCSVCDTELSRETFDLPLANHTYGEWYTYYVAFSTTGTEKHDCSCGASETRKADAVKHHTITFGSAGNYHTPVEGVDLSNIKIGDNGGNNAQIKEGYITIALKAGAVLTINGYPNYTNYNLDDGTTTVENITETNYVYETNVDVVVTISHVYGQNGNNYFYSIDINYPSVIRENIEITFGSAGNYKTPVDGVNLSTIEIADNGGNNSQVKNGYITLTVKAGATVTIHGYSGYTSYNINGGEEITAEYHSYTATVDEEIVITPVNGGKNYFYSISVTYPEPTKYVEENTVISFGSEGNYKTPVEGVELSVQVGDNGGNNSQVKNGTITINVKAGGKVIVNGYPNYTTYTFSDGEITVDITDTTYVYTAETDITVTISVGDVNNYFYSIAVEYEHEYASAVTKPTCEAAGYTTHTCALCGDTYTSDEVAALGHDEVSHDAKAATCIEIGWNAYVKCTRCDYTTYVEIGALGHDMVTDKAVAPTCTENGLTAGSHCSRCDDATTAQEVVPATGHDHEAVVTAPDCVNGGYTTYTCVCGNSYVSDHTDALGHSFTNYVSNDDATCTEDGTKTAKCDRCDATDTQVDVDSKLGHTSGDVVAENVVPNDCVNNGSHDEVVYCTVCGTELSRTTVTDEAKGHDYDVVVTAPTCESKGYTTHSCKNCDNEKVTDEVAATGHNIVTDKAVAPTCTETGLTEGEHCTKCDYKVAQETVNALGHDEYDLEEKAATCEEDGSEGGTGCRTCGEILVAATVIPALGHKHTNGNVICDNCGLEKQGGWTLVTNVSQLVAGGKVVIAANGSNYAMSTTQNGNNRGQTAITKSGNSLTVTSSVQIFTLQTGKTSGTFAFYTGSGYIYAASSSSNYLRTETSLSNNSSWTITVTSAGVATVKANGSNTRNVMQYNQSNSLFACYSSASQKAISLYVMTEKYVEHVHTEKTLSAKAPTCENTGLTEGKQCTVCGEVTVAQTEVPATGHNYVIDTAVAPTCQKTGLTEGTHCANGCGIGTVAQEEVPVIECNFVNGTCTMCGVAESHVCSPAEAKEENRVEATCTENGSYDMVVYCEGCGDKLSTEHFSVEATGHNFEGGACTKCGEADPDAAPVETSATMSIFGNKGTKSGTSISWTSGDITFKNTQANGSTAIRNSDSDHYRVYQGSTVTISAGANQKITKIVITCTSSSYANVMQTSLKNAGYTATVSSSTVTVTVNSAESITFTASAQTRLNKIVVTYLK